MRSFFVIKWCVVFLLAVASIQCFAQSLSGTRSDEINQYIKTSFDNQVTEVIVKKNDIIINGNTSGNQNNFYLCEWRMFNETKLVSDSFASITPINTRKPGFTIQLPRFTSFHDTGYDRIYSRWVVASNKGANYQLQSYARYATDITGAENQYIPEDKPISKKGLAGFAVAPNTTEDILNLGIKNVTVNIVIPNFITFSPTAYSYILNGQKFYFNPDYVNNFDRTIKTCTDNNIIITGLLLIQRALIEPRKSIFVYPTSNSGVHSIANITSITGLNYYAAVVGFLADRYSRLDKKFGRISNWVVHNEVDAATYWANAGPAGMAAFTELYDRSLRTVYYTIKQYNPAGKVFLSFTHFWTIAARPGDFAPKEMLDLFNELSRKQGDYEWGVSYHPYAVSLFSPKPWDDKDITNDWKTSKYITPKNIELIDDWMRMGSHLYNGLKVRTLMFTEQGVHTKSNSKEDQLIQAAGVAYMWKKCSRLPSVEAFDYHGQADNLYENGMMFGLWTVKQGTKGTPDLKKPSWLVYQKAGTLSEDSAFAFALPIIGISNWQQIYNPISQQNLPVTVTFKVTRNGSNANDISVYFNGEMHKTINGVATFYNVAANATINRNYRLELNGSTIYPAHQINVTRPQTILVNL